ncbi:MAG: hypothetical protein HS111_12845 [Kofleriaceae bacterium]|nr:hypothetical protein [Kofleriaceae bacterium]MCL4224249.1 hypothetical protein [Myxococcales bacterium]
MPTFEHLLANQIERASRRIVWQTPMEKRNSVAGLYENLGDYTRPGGVVFHGLGLARGKSGGLIVEAYAQCAPSDRVRARRSVAALLGIPAGAVSVVPCWGFHPSVGMGEPGAHYALANQDRFGTIGGFAADLESSLILAVSNNHVFADNNRGRLHDPLLDATGQFGGLVRFPPLLQPPAVNVLDGAVGWIGDGHVIAAPVSASGTRPATRGLRVKKFGAASGHTTGVVVATVATATVPYDGLGSVNFRRCLRIEGDGGPFSVPGDSGSLVLDSRNAVVGIIFAGDETGGYSLANPVDALTGLLNIAF